MLKALDVELLCLRNQLRFILRHRRYLVITLALWAAGFGRWRERRVVRTGFCALQAIDDLLDGDRACEGEPLDVVEELVKQIESREFGTSPLERLVAAFVQDLEAAGGQPALDQAVELIRVMQRDRVRQRDHIVLSEDELTEHHRKTFTLSLDLMLIAGDCEARSGDVPELTDALGWCSTVRDLEEDLGRGLINLPAGVVDGVKDELGTDEPSGWLESRAVEDWLETQRRHALDLLDAADRRLVDLGDRTGTSVLRRFSRSVRRYADRR